MPHSTRTRSRTFLKAVERKKKKIENTVVVDRPHARKHGIKCGEPCPRLELYEQFPNGVEGLRLWHNTNARKGQRLAYFDIVKKVETYGAHLGACAEAQLQQEQE